MIINTIFLLAMIRNADMNLDGALKYIERVDTDLEEDLQTRTEYAWFAVRNALRLTEERLGLLEGQNVVQ